MADLHKLLRLPGDPNAKFEGDLNSDMLISVKDGDTERMRLVEKYKAQLASDIETTRRRSRTILRVLKQPEA